MAVVSGFVVLLAVLFVMSEDPRPSRTRTAAGKEVPTQQMGEQKALKYYEDLCKKAESHVENGNYNTTEAIRLYELATELVPAHPLAHFNLARVCFLFLFSLLRHIGVTCTQFAAFPL